MKKIWLALAMLFIATLPVRAQIQIPPNIVNAGSTGTSVNHLVKLTGTPSTAVIASAGDTQGIVGICDANCGTSGFPNVATAGVDVCAFDGATTAGDYVQISATTAGDCHDTGSAAVPTSGEIIGRVLASIGSSGNSSIIIGIENSVGGGGGSGGVGSGSTGQAAVYNSSSTVASIPIAIYPDALTSAGGVGAAQTAWAAATSYPLCQSVSSSGNYIAVSSSNNNITPGSNSHIWYPVPNGSRPTAFDCGFYIAQSQVTSTVGVNLQLGSGTYNSCIGMSYPTVSNPGGAGVNIHGMGVNSSTVTQTCTLIAANGGDGLAMLNVPAAATSFNLPRLQFSGFALEGNGLVSSIFDLHACQQCTIEHVELRDAADGSDHYFEAGTVGGTQKGWVYELTMEDVTTSYNAGTIGIGHGNGAFAATVTVSGGVPTISITTPGANYGGQTKFRLVKAGGLEACTSIGTFTPTYNGTFGVSALTTTSSGCAATGQTFVQIFPQTNVAYSFKFSNMSDSHFISDLIPGGVGATCGVNVSNTTSFNTFYKMHPIATFNGICNQGTNNFVSSQIDSVYNWGIDEEGQGDVANYYGTMFEWNSSTLNGSSDYHFGKVTSPPVNAPAAVNIFGDMCGNTPNQSGYAHLVSATTQVDTSSIGLPSFVNIYQTQYCNQKNSNTIEYTNSAHDIIWSNGTTFNYWDYNLQNGSNTAMTLTNSQAPAGSPFSLTYVPFVAANSGANVKGPTLGSQAAYWDGSVSQLFGWQIAPTCAAGTGPLCTFAFKKLGTPPAASYQWTFDAPTLLPTGSTAVTQSTGDTSTDIATDAFVANSIAAGVVGCTPSGTVGTIQATNGSGACQATALADSGTNITSTEPILAPSETLGTSGTSVGSVAFNNATSGSITLAPTTGALGTVTLTMPAATDTIATLAATQTLTNKSIAASEVNSGQVAVAQGGTGLGSGTSGGVLGYTGSGVLASSAALTANSPVLGGGVGATPNTVAGITTDGTSKLTLGVAGTSVGAVALNNATSGSVTLAPTTGALGTVTATLPANTGTIAETNLAQTWSAAQALGSSTATTQAASDNSTKLATTAYVTTAIPTGCMSGCSYGVGTGSDSPTPYGGNTTAMTANNNPQLVKFWNNITRTLGNATVRVVGGSASGHFDVGVYSISGTTATLIWHSGSQSTTTANTNFTVTTTPVTLSGGTSYYIAWCADNTSATIMGITNAALTNSVGATSAAHSFGVDATDTCTAGVLPGTVTTTNIVNNASASQAGIYATN